MKSDEYTTRLTRAISLLEIAEDQVIEARTECLLCQCLETGIELKIIRGSFKKMLEELRTKLTEYIESTPL